MKRVLSVAVLALTVAVVTPTGAAHAVVPTACDVQPLAEQQPGQVLVFAKAGPFLYPGASSVTVFCELRLGAVDGPVLDVIYNGVGLPGPVGVLATDRFIPDLPFGAIYACTYTRVGGTTQLHHCGFVFQH